MQLFNNIQDEIISRIKESTLSLKIAVTWFTNNELFEAIVNKLKEPNYEIELIVLNDRINNKREGVDFQNLINLGGDFYFSEVEKMVHHKFCIIDNKQVITGSYNWTYYAENRNWENIVVLDNKKIVKAFIEEFDKIKMHHRKVTNVALIQKYDQIDTSNEYLQVDYSYQANREKQKGNIVNLAKIYTEILRLNQNRPEIQIARKEIINKLNGQKFTVCPFEIGIHFKSGYVMAIPAFAPLPIRVVKLGLTSADNSTSLRITIQKYDIIPMTILQFSLANIKPCPKDTVKVEQTLILDENGFLKVLCIELNGYGRRIDRGVDLKNWL